MPFSNARLIHNPDYKITDTGKQHYIQFWVNVINDHLRVTEITTKCPFAMCTFCFKSHVYGHSNKGRWRNLFQKQLTHNVAHWFKFNAFYDSFSKPFQETSWSVMYKSSQIGIISEDFYLPTYRGRCVGNSRKNTSKPCNAV